MSPSATAAQSSHFTGETLPVLHWTVSGWCPCVGGSCAQALYVAAISFSGFVQGLGTRVARVGVRCAVMWLASA